VERMRGSARVRVGVGVLVVAFLMSGVGTARADVPGITDVVPGEGPVGAAVTVSGSGFSAASEVSFNGMDDPGFAVVDDGTIDATVPVGATSGPITVVVDGTTLTSPDSFVVDPPNIVLILTDDQRWDQLGSWMPTVASEIEAKGVTFNNGFVINPLCCPSRSTILTGQTSGHTGVWNNGGAFGGFGAFHDSSTVATWLHGAGYRTGLIGKYLNHYMKADIPYIPPGWDEWQAMVFGGSPQCKIPNYFNYCLSNDGVEEDHGSAASDYSTDVYARKAVDFVDATPPGQPLFLYFAPHAPHSPATPPPRYVSACGDAVLPSPPSFNESDVSDKPAYVQRLPPLSRQRLNGQLRHWTQACQSLRAVDDAVAGIVSELTATDRISNTLFLFASDNGLLYGEHRWRGKVVPYDESIRVPVMIRYDPLTHGTATTNDDLVLNEDFASTFAQAASVTPGLPQDGQSLLPLLSDPSAPWRTSFLLEHFGPKVPSYCGIRTENMSYVRYVTGEQELYDLSADPYQDQNVAGSPAYAGDLATLAAETRTLCDPPPPDWSWPP
jgi:N-acetylglucosamine-6-sulfatase